MHQQLSTTESSRRLAASDGEPLGPGKRTNPRGPVLPRLDIDRLRSHLPKRQRIRIEVNGVLAGAPEAIPDASREFAIGWVFMQRFLQSAEQLGTISATESHVSVMIEGGADLDRVKYESIGWIPREDLAEPPGAVSERTPMAAPVMGEMDAIASCQEAFARFERDGANVGYRHAAIVTTDEVVCVARDLNNSAATAKVLGWGLTSEFDFSTSMLVVSGVVDAPVVEAAGRCGIGVVATDAIPTLGAIDTAVRDCVSLLGLVRSHRRGLFADSGHLNEDALPDLVGAEAL